MNYILLFIEGIVTFISPCILPMVPMYITYFMGSDGEKNKNKALVNSIGFVLGFTFIFTLLGAAASTVGVLFNKHIEEINLISGVFIVILGLNYIEILNIKFLQRSLKLKGNFIKKKFNLFSSILFGIVFGIGWTPCVGPFLGSALMIATNSKHLVQGVFMLILYSLGLGIPFVVSALLIDSLKNTFDFIKRNYRLINKISGSLLIIIGIMMMTGHFNAVLSLFTF
ncbi:cytochrome c biogenesis CcdA family protein [Clostridium oceanicum]|uniref:Cytochrome c biogenesis protein CcdA n=1 Tax=Clostridium oceanicum TaxID=1543 RepID=A0ABP3UP53_9CLOT